MRRLKLAVPALALVTALTGCSQPGGQNTVQSSGQSFDPISSISALIKTANSSMQDKSTVTMTMDMSGGISSKLPEIMSGAFDMTCEVDMKQSKMSCDGGAFDMIITKASMYFKYPMMKNEAKPWIKVDTTGAMAQSLKKSFAKMKKFTDFKSMLPEGSKITGSSSAQVNGQQAIRYDVTIDLSKAIQNQSGLAKKGLQRFAEQGVTELTKAVWVSESGLPLKVKATMPSFEVMEKTIPETTVTVTYSNWGKPVDITIPQASKVREKMMPSMPQMPDMPN